MEEKTESVLRADIVRGISKAGRPYECIEVTFNGMSVGRIFPTPLEMSAIKNALNS
ncbi:hypothetical protein [Bifidobacterium longum]|uniref:Uncharacterized protein n=1 Tax=Bifidobacterium longum subsp. longum TaxID=1679 RepID=A0ABD7WL75_BIFLL|nr:hypothetical protein [Bifidobacterium longum]MBN7935851.1 hypothetical protein [Bifidobacterium longum subsp. longum]PKC79888.1 hypothetical protein DPC6321_0262 [Bifidobacterium longum]QSG86240.1 hypothetical protein BLS995_06005 [Bifidobacterium longum subsp. suillum]QXT30694.1 hypothetical protein BLS605_06840 [Bifidobacterium longum subsp. suillum]TCF47325.1 hypothetical protein MCC10103_0259 [Bifidobacterium longum subsp. longum]